jgi:hypothetical protein
MITFTKVHLSNWKTKKQDIAKHWNTEHCPEPEEERAETKPAIKTPFMCEWCEELYYDIEEVEHDDATWTCSCCEHVSDLSTIKTASLPTHP